VLMGVGTPVTARIMRDATRLPRHVCHACSSSENSTFAFRAG